MALAFTADTILGSSTACAAYACPSCFGLEEMSSGIYVERTVPAQGRAKIAQIVSQAKDQVASFYGSFERQPTLLICTTDECNRRLGGRRQKADTFGASRGGPGCSDRISASISGTSAGIRPPSGLAASCVLRSKLDRVSAGQGSNAVACRCKSSDNGQSQRGLREHWHRRADKPPRI